MTARTLLHFCEPLVLRGLLAAAGISVSRPLLSKDSEVVEVALSSGASFSKDSPWLEKVPRRYSSDNLRRRQNPDGLPLSLSFSPSRLAPFARLRGNSSLSFVLPSYFSSLSSHFFFLPSHFSFLPISLHFFYTRSPPFSRFSFLRSFFCLTTTFQRHLSTIAQTFTLTSIMVSSRCYAHTHTLTFFFFCVYVFVDIVGINAFGCLC